MICCSRNCAVQLAQFHANGTLGRLHRPRDLLLVIAQPNCRDAMALWVMGHAEELVDPDCCNAFLIAPLEYALGLMSLSQVRTERPAPVPGPELGPLSDRKTLTWAAAIGVVGLLVWRRQRRLASELPA